MSKNKKVLAIIAVFVLAIAIFVFSSVFEEESEKTVTVNEEYSVQIPRSWNYRIGAESELVISNYGGELAFQDRSAEEEAARITIRKIEKEGLTIEEYSKNITDSYEEGEISVTDKTIADLPTLKIDIPMQDSAYHIVDGGDNFYIIFSSIFEEDSSKLRNTLNEIIISFNLLK